MDHQDIIFSPGDKVTWLYTPRGGYGYTFRLDVKVVKLGKKRVLIEVLKADNETFVQRWVSRENLIFYGNL